METKAEQERKDREEQVDMHRRKEKDGSPQMVR